MGGRDALRGSIAGGAAIAVIFAGVSPTPPPAPELTGVTYGVGGSGDGFGITIPWNFNGTIVPQGDTYQSVIYPAALNSDIPLISDLPWLSELPYWPQSGDSSAAIGREKLSAALATVPAGEKTTVIGMSQGAQIVDQIRVTLTKDKNSPDYQFILLGNPIRPDGGIYTRFPWLGTVPLLGVTFGRPDAVDSDFPTTDIVNQYDFFADFPRYFNPLAIVNAVFGLVFEHLLPGYIFDDPENPNRVSTTVGNTTYVTLPTNLLPLLLPFRAIASLVGLGSWVDSLDPVLRVLVETGYDRTADPSKVQPFEFVTPAAKMAEALLQLPAAMAEGQRILAGGPLPAATLPTPIVSTPVAAMAADTGQLVAATSEKVAAVADAVPAPETATPVALESVAPEAVQDEPGRVVPDAVEPSSDAAAESSSDSTSDPVAPESVEPSSDSTPAEAAAEPDPEPEPKPKANPEPAAAANPSSDTNDKSSSTPAKVGSGADTAASSSQEKSDAA